MKIRIRSITVKTAIAYLILAAISLSIVCMVVYENQIDLIAENTRYRVSAAAADTIAGIDALSAAPAASVMSREDRIRSLVPLVGKKTGNYALFTEQGEVLYREGSAGAISPADILSGIKAVTGKDFAGKRYFSSVSERTYEISFYIPLTIPQLEGSILLMKFSIKEIHDQLSALYRQILFLIAALCALHLIVGIAVYLLVIAPMKHLHAKSVEIAGGNLSARTDIRQEDEIGDLGNAFNAMAESIQEKITTLLFQKKTSDDELCVAGDVQQIIFPDLPDSEHLRYGLFRRPFNRVSGDYFDVLPLKDGKTGFLMADVSGHGVPAALLTMLVKQVFRQYAHEITDPAELFRKVNDEITVILSSNRRTIYFTAFYAVLSPDNTLSWCKAGHLDQYILRADGSLIPLTSNGFIVGVESSLNYLFETESAAVQKGDTIVLFTDGIVEACSPEGEAYGDERFAVSLKAAAGLDVREIPGRLAGDLAAFTSGEDKLMDDATIFAIGIR
jgi:sigma-B regulation protein RsbU (phosphoserine phosphatase)